MKVPYRFIAALITLCLLAPALHAQARRAPAGPSKPTPRWPDGHPRLSSEPVENGFWQPNGRPILAEPETDPAIKDGQGRGAPSGPPFPGKPKESEVPWQPWARALYQYREANLFEPHNTHIVPAWRFLTWVLVACAGNLERVPAAFAMASYSILVSVMFVSFSVLGSANRGLVSTDRKPVVLCRAHKKSRRLPLESGFCC